MTVAVDQRAETLGIPARILVAGNGLLSGALASALMSYGFATRHIVPRIPEVWRGIEWRPNLVLLDIRSLDVPSGFALVAGLSREGLRVCVIDAAQDDRLSAWRGAGASAVVDRGEQFDELFRTINRLLRSGSAPPDVQRSPAPVTFSTGAEEPEETHLQPFTVLTEREQVVLAELIEGHCAEEIANAAFVSISTVRSQIKAILQKLGVNSQLAAVAFARRAGWSLDVTEAAAPRAAPGRRARVS